MQVFFSTVVRNAPLSRSGEVVRVDWPSKQVVARAPVYATNPTLDDPNPRGGSRGGRGIEILGNELLVSTYHTLKVFDLNLRHLRDIAHPLMVQLHETRLTPPNKVWFTSTAIDAAVELDLSTGQGTRQFWPREHPLLQKKFGLVPLDIDKNADNRALFVRRRADASHTHLNAVICWRDRILALLNRFGVVVDLESGDVVVEDKELEGGHNLGLLHDDVLVINDTRGRTVRLYQLPGGTPIKRIDLMRYPFVRRISRRFDAKFAAASALSRVPRVSVKTFRPVFMRGLDIVDDHLFVGISPASVLRIDSESGDLVDYFAFASAVAVCVNGLRCLPAQP